MLGLIKLFLRNFLGLQNSAQARHGYCNPNILEVKARGLELSVGFRKTVSQTNEQPPASKTR